MTQIIAWGHNPGQRFTKDVISKDSARRELKPYPSVIAPYQERDDTGMAGRGRDLVATVNGAHYIGGDAAERLPMQNRQMSDGRLDDSSPMYQALIQMSAQHTGMIGADKSTQVVIATALPSGWRSDESEDRLKAHIRSGLRGIVGIKNIYVQSEPNAIIFNEVLDDNGQRRSDASAITNGLVCIGDLGGGTINRTVIDCMKSLPGQADSPAMGSRQIIEIMMHKAGIQYIDAERRIIDAVRNPGKDSVADALLRQYREMVIAEFERAWSIYSPVSYIFAGGTVNWVGHDLLMAFPRSKIVDNPQMAIAVGLWKYALLKTRQ